MKKLILVLCILVGGAWWCYAIIDLMFIHTWVGLMGIWAGAALFLLGFGEINELEDYEIE
jgi:hypothetical protein